MDYQMSASPPPTALTNVQENNVFLGTASPRNKLEEVGKAWKGADPSTLRLIVRLFPAPTLGQVFVVRFIERAAIERSIIPDLRPGDAVICTQSIATLARDLDLAYDTTQKYVSLFKGLGMLRKQPFMGHFAFIFSLGIYQAPQNLEANLDYLLQRSQTKKSRTKFHSLVAEVKSRCLVYGLISQEWTQELRHLHTLIAPPKAGLSRRKLVARLAEAQHLVSSMIARAMTARLPAGETPPPNLPRSSKQGAGGEPEPSGESTQLEKSARSKGKVLPPNLPGEVPPGFAPRITRLLESTQIGSAGRFQESSPPPNLSGRGVQVDSQGSNPRQESTQGDGTGRFAHAQPDQNLSKPSAQGDSRKPGRETESTRERDLGGFSASATPDNLPSQAAGVDSDDVANVNVRDLITRNINVNVGVVAACLCQLFGEPKSKQGIYSKLLRECNQAEAVHAAVIFTLVHFYRDRTIANRAAVFIARCRDYHQQGIPNEAAGLVAEYGSLTCQQLRERAEQSARAREQSLPHGASPGSSTPRGLPPLPKPTDLKPRIPLRPGGGMTREEALGLRSQIAHDQRVGMCRTGIVPLVDGSFAVLLDYTANASRVRQAAVYSAQEWQESREQVCATLFASSGASILAPARARLRACRLAPETERGKK